MLYGLECECGEEIDLRRYQLGYKTCLVCGDIEAKARKFTIVPMHKSNYVAIFDRSDLLGINNKGGVSQVSEPREPSFEEDFDCDTEPFEQVDVSLLDIAITKGHAYAQGYNTYIGRIEDREGYHHLKQGYQDGFLAGFAFRMGGGHEGN